SLLEGYGASRAASNKAKETMRWRTHRMVEDYVNTCGGIVYPRVAVGAFGYKPEEGRFPMERPTTLGMLKTPLRRGSVIEKWSPYQVGLFEAAISTHGKVFHKVAEEVDGKSVPDVVEFYYMWKKTNHYKQWKAMFRAEQSILQVQEESEEEEEEEDEGVGGRGKEEKEQEKRKTAPGKGGGGQQGKQVEIGRRSSSGHSGSSGGGGAAGGRAGGGQPQGRGSGSSHPNPRGGGGSQPNSRVGGGNQSNSRGGGGSQPHSRGAG
ncbi:unnamed protein product, partial [Scytosiphon promiscuus]